MNFNFIHKKDSNLNFNHEFKVAAWQHNGGDMRTRDYKVCNYETDDDAELMEENFGNEGEDDDTFTG